MGKPIGNLEEKRGHENLFLGGYKFGSRENPDMRCFSLFLQKVALYQLCEGTCRQPSFMVLWVELRSPLARPQHGHVFPQGSCSWRSRTPLVLLKWLCTAALWRHLEHSALTHGTALPEAHTARGKHGKKGRRVVCCSVDFPQATSLF